MPPHPKGPRGGGRDDFSPALLAGAAGESPESGEKSETTDLRTPQQGSGLVAKALVRPGAAGGAPCISADVPLGAEGATVVGSFTVEGLTFAVRPTLVAQLLAEGGVPSAEDGAGSDAAGWAPAEAARVADGGLQVELVGVVPGALAARGTDGLAAATAGEASSATLALPESIVYQGVGYLSLIHI